MRIILKKYEYKELDYQKKNINESSLGDHYTFIKMENTFIVNHF